MKLNDKIAEHFKLNIWQKKGLAKLKLETIEDLLRHTPSRYIEPSKKTMIEDAIKGDNVILEGNLTEIKSQKSWRKKINFTEAYLKDDSGKIKVIWFNQPYISKIIREGEIVSLNGKISQNKKELYLANPDFNKKEFPAAPVLETHFIPQYPETRGLSAKWVRFAIAKILGLINKSEFKDFIPDYILKKYHLPNFSNSILSIHNPRNFGNSEAARKRFAFEEIFLIQLAKIKEKILINSKSSFKIEVDYEKLKSFIHSFPFKLTDAQRKAIFHVAEDFKKNIPMTRLLHGDVGSGKTVVAIAASFLTVENKYQTAYMAPTEILARQHFETFISLGNLFRDNLSAAPLKIGLITSSECKKFPSKVNPKKSTHISKNQLLKWVKSGEINILIGTHSLIQNKVIFKNLAFTIIDEQHRFGVNQRLKIVRKNNDKVPHLLSMTATPIPRTLALTIYGDLDLTLLDEMPPERKPVITYIVPPKDRFRAYEHIKEEIKNGRQAYIVCPRIETGSEKLEVRNVKDETERLKKEIFPEFEIAMLHSKLLPKEKEKIMNGFKEKKIDILVSTSVIEVGVDVPNANCILIEGADRFGLAQLHQLRGRVLRSGNQSFCFVLSDSPTVAVLKRLAVLKQAKNGFELAENDLKFRGPGAIFGKKQWGISDLGMEALKNIKMVEAARCEALEILKKDLELKSFPDLKQKILSYETNLHWE